VPPALLQKYINKWLSTAYDLFGKDSSSSAEWFYVWGLKGRYDESRQTPSVDKAHLNELSREMYRQEAEKLLQSISKLLPAGADPLIAPDMRFHRSIGEHAGATYSVRGELLSPEAYAKHASEVLPNEEEKAFIRGLMREPGWIADRSEVVAS
jgi:hypothetical protein